MSHTSMKQKLIANLTKPHPHKQEEIFLLICNSDLLHILFNRPSSCCINLQNNGQHLQPLASAVAPLEQLQLK